MSWQHTNKIIELSNKDRRKLRFTGKRGHESFYVTIPKPWIHKLEWKQGDDLLLELQDNKIIIRKVMPCDSCRFSEKCSEEKKQYVSDVEKCIHYKVKMAFLR